MTLRDQERQGEHEHTQPADVGTPRADRFVGYCCKKEAEAGDTAQNKICTHTPSESALLIAKSVFWLVLTFVVLHVGIDLRTLIRNLDARTETSAADIHILSEATSRTLASVPPVVSNVQRATNSIANAAEKWNKASDAQIQNVNKTGEDTRRVIAHFDRVLTNQVVPTLDNLKATSAEGPAAVRALTQTANAATSALNATKVPMDDLHLLLSDRQKGMPALLDESTSTMEELHATAGNFEVWSEKFTHPASALKSWFNGLLDIAFKSHSLATGK